MVAALGLTGAKIEGEEDATMLDKLVLMDDVVHLNAYVYWESGLSDPEDNLEELDEEFRSPERVRLASSIEDLLRAILKINRDKTDYLKLEGAHTCSRMRPDGFGGSALVVTETEYAWVSTSALSGDGGRINLDHYEIKKFDEPAQTTG